MTADSTMGFPSTPLPVKLSLQGPQTSLFPRCSDQRHDTKTECCCVLQRKAGSNLGQLKLETILTSRDRCELWSRGDDQQDNLGKKLFPNSVCDFFTQSLCRAGCCFLGEDSLPSPVTCPQQRKGKALEWVMLQHQSFLTKAVCGQFKLKSKGRARRLRCFFCLLYQMWTAQL